MKKNVFGIIFLKGDHTSLDEAKLSATFARQSDEHGFALSQGAEATHKIVDFDRGLLMAHEWPYYLVDDSLEPEDSMLSQEGQLMVIRNWAVKVNDIFVRLFETGCVEHIEIYLEEYAETFLTWTSLLDSFVEAVVNVYRLGEPRPDCHIIVKLD
jgi:hypothetical protein